MKFQLNNLAETKAWASLLEKNLQPGTVVALNGDLGAGKTALAKAIVGHSGSSEIVTSPTFVIMNVYPGPKKFYHFDLYRLNSAEDLEEIGAEEFFPAPDGITLVEWAEKIPEILPPNHLEIKIEIQDETTRKIELIPHGQFKIKELKWPS